MSSVSVEDVRSLWPALHSINIEPAVINYYGVYRVNIKTSQNDSFVTTCNSLEEVYGYLRGLIDAKRYFV